MLGDIYFVVSYCNQMIFGQFDNCVSLLELGRNHFSQKQIFKLNLKEDCMKKDNMKDLIFQFCLVYIRNSNYVFYTSKFHTFF